MKKIIILTISLFLLFSCSSITDNMKQDSIETLKWMGYDVNSKSKEEICKDYYSLKWYMLSDWIIKYDTVTNTCVQYLTDTVSIVSKISQDYLFFRDLKYVYDNSLKEKELMERIISNSWQTNEKEDSNSISKEEIEKMKLIIKEYEWK